MRTTVELIEKVLPLVYTISSAAFIYRLSKKPVHLDQYDNLEPSEDQDGYEQQQQQQNSDERRHTDSTLLQEQHALQMQYQAQRAKGMSIDLGRLGLSALQFGLTMFSIILIHSGKEEIPAKDTTLGDLSQALSWAFALSLSFVLLMKPAVASQFYIRPVMDFYYLLEWFLGVIGLYEAGVLVLPIREWPQWAKMEGMSLFVITLLLWISASALPFAAAPKRPRLSLVKNKETGAMILEPRQPSSEYASSFYSQMVFGWINPLIYLGYRRSLQDIDLPDLEDDDQSKHSIRLFKPVKGKTFTRRLLWTLRSEFVIQALWALPWCLLVNASPFCMNKIIQYMQCVDCGPPTFDNYKWVYALLIASFFESMFYQAALHKGRRIFVHLTSIVSSEIYDKSLRRKDIAAPDKEKDSGKKGDDKDAEKKKSINIANLVAVDLNRMVIAFSYLHQVYGYPIQFIFASIQLYWLLGYAALVGIGFMFVSYPVPTMLFSAMMKLFKAIMTTKDERMDGINEMLSAIRIVKFFGWESKFVEKITATRTKELDQERRTFIRITIANISWMIVPLLNIIVMFLAYTKLFGNEMTAAVMFTTLALFNIMRSALNQIPWNIQNLMQTMVSLDRMNRFLEEEDIIRDTTVTKIDAKAKVSTDPIIGFVNASFVWPNKEHEKAEAKVAEKASLFQRFKSMFSKTPKKVEEPVPEVATPQERFKLKNISVDFPVGQLSVIVGPTGSGKSALLLALLGELEREEGAMFMPRLDYSENKATDRGSGIAYAAQTAWLQNTTIRNNILFGKPFDQDRYDAVLEGCALNPDMEILESGDATEIGEQGITLSGGQKQRVALARAIYSDATVLLLDDCLSAVDSHTGKHLFETLTGPLLEGRTVLMATHQVQLTMNAASLVVVLNKGEILGSGTPAQVISNGWVDHVTLAAPVSDENSEVGTLHGGADAKKGKKADPNRKTTTKLTEDEKKVEGAVAWKVYQTYVSASGGIPYWLGLVIVFLIGEAVNVGQNAWLAVWANKMAESTGAFVSQAFHLVTPEPIALSIYAAFAPIDGREPGTMTMSLFSNEPVSVNFYIGVYVLISTFTMVFMVLMNFYTLYGTLRASRIIHEQLLHKISRAKVRFFDTTPIGRIINRFSSDMSTIDDNVMHGLQWFMQGVVNLIGIIFIISTNTPSFLIAAVGIVSIYGVIGALYVPISRDLKRLNSNSRSPILNHINETLTGLATIRAYGFETRFQAKNLVNTDDNNRTFFLLWSTNRWLHWRVDIVGALVAFTTGLLVLGSWGTLAPGWAALSMTYSLMFTHTIVWLIRSYAENEMAMNSVERVAEYMDLEEEPDAIIAGSRPPASWPHSGEIIVDHLTMKYAPDTPEVIKDISFKINAGEKVGVVGRTGSGKSTLAISLFRFMEPVNGSIRIDGIDIGSIGLYDLRSNLTIIPQDPILFKGTLRFNLDPFSEREDEELWQALRRSHLIPETTKLTVDDPAATAVPSEASSMTGESTKKSPAGSVKGVEAEIVDPSKITLDTPVKENGSNFSQGQRQLIALARALVRQSKIIIMDEATASVDFETDLKIQTTIREEMADSTIITIAHRIRTIADFDRVLVMNAGEIAEYDKPLTLMQKEDGLFRSMCERSTEFDALYAIAQAKEQKDAAL
ncbi:hypothetical protein EMPS_10241 [Entomortierella parvispora]|uniref:ABC transporter n=1 Tax=Entomortierella parvispora TaxID=205924 RepID=A0A9P3HKF0_9FUNG|nr:hypothetical protein EMPS_10241 [Entomortierella parvispora]